MTDSTDVPSLDGPPDATQIASLRERASQEDTSVRVTFPGRDGEMKRFVVSPRGACVVLKDLRETSFNPSVAAEDVSAALHD